MDGVLADMDGALAREAEGLFGERQLPLSARQETRLWQHVALLENFWEGVDPLEPGVVPRLATLAADQEWEVIFLTKRPNTRGATAQIQTQRWLEANGFPRPSVYVVQGSRGAIAAALDLDVVVDDRVENCMDVVAASKARAILVWRTGTTQLPAAVNRLGIGVVPSVDECLRILGEWGTTPSTEPSALARLMRLLGLGEPALD